MIFFRTTFLSARSRFWARRIALYLRSVKLEDPQFSGQTKERLGSRACAAFVSGVVRDALSLWLHQHVETGERIAEIAAMSTLSARPPGTR